MNDKQKSFYHTQAWYKCRDAYSKSVGGLCERCAAKGLIRPGKIVHHKEYISAENINDPEILLCFDNLELLCQDCHNAEHKLNKTNQEKRYIVCANGTIKGIDAQ